MTIQEQEVNNLFSRSNARHTAKVVIRELAHLHQYITADMVQDHLVHLGFSVSDLGNAAGSMFRGNEFVKKVPGITVRSKREGRRGSAIGVYESKVYTGNPFKYASRFVAEYNGAQ